jgi:myo-inositol-1(or 4)-monophosphatase
VYLYQVESALTSEGMITLESNIDWLKVLSQCRQNVKKHIEPYLKNLKDAQKDLGKTGAGGDIMKPADLAAEKAIVEVMLNNGISFTLISEESGLQEYGAKADQCYLTTDPIDGTTNFLRGLPFYCTSVAISRKPQISQVYAAMVTDLYHDTMYIGIEGNGAFRDGKKLTSSTLASLEEGVVGLDLNTYKVRDIAPQLSDLIQKTKHIRHFGANALELCYVAEGLTDAFIDIRGKLRTTDIAAGFLIIKEAGGTITTPEGHPVEAKLDPQEKVSFVASGNLEIHRTILDLVKPK